MLKRLYDWTMGLASHRHAILALAFISFIEASVFPIPPDVLMIPLILAQPKKAWVIATVCLISSVMGGMFGYAIGAFFYDSIGEPILTALGKGDAVTAFNARFNDYSFWAVLVAGITPFPFKVITILSGWTSMPFWIFLTTSLIARAIRFYVVAALLWKFGAPIREFVENRLGLVFTAFVVILIGGFFLVGYL